MKTMHTGFRLTVLSAALMAVFGPAQADEAEINEQTRPESTVSVGLGSWSAARPWLGQYDGMRGSGIYGLLDADIVRRNDATGTWLRFNAANLGLDTREMRAEYERQGSFGAFIEYNRSVREHPYNINTPLQGIGTPNLVMGTTLAPTPRSNVELGISRELTRLGGFTKLMPGVDFKLDFRNEDKKGARHWGWGSAALFSAEPIDSNTRQLDAILQFTGKKLQLSGGYSGSWYDNHHGQVLQQLNGISGGTSASFNAITPLSLPLDNSAHQVFMDGGYSFTPTTRGSFKLSYTRATQDEELPSYRLTGANAPFNRAPSRLDGRVDTTLAQFGLSSRPFPRLSVTGNLRYYDVNDKTPVNGFVGNNTTGAVTVYNTPYSYTTKSGKLEATYRLPASFNVTGGVDYSDQDRSSPTIGTVYVPYRNDVTEITYRVQVRRSLADNFNGTLAYLHSERDGSGYTDAPGTLPYSNQVNPIHIADRTRQKIRAAFEWDPLEKLSLQFRSEFGRDEYPENGRPYGPRDGSSQFHGVDASYELSEKWALTAFYSRDVTKARQVGFRTATGGAANALREARLKDTGDTLGFGVRGHPTAKLQTNAGLDWSRTTSRFPQDVTLTGAGTVYPTGGTGPLPDVKSSILRFKFDATYALNKGSDLRFDLIFERWKTNDWQWDFANGDPFRYYSGTVNCAGCTPTATPNVQDGTTVTHKKQQISTFVGVRYIYKFQ